MWDIPLSFFPLPFFLKEGRAYFSLYLGHRSGPSPFLYLCRHPIVVCPHYSRVCGFRFLRARPLHINIVYIISVYNTKKIYHFFIWELSFSLFSLDILLKVAWGVSIYLSWYWVRFLAVYVCS